MVYQVLVDRFAPPIDPAGKSVFYPPPRRFRHWDELPTAGSYLPAEQVWSHELDFWGGDLASTRSKLDYLAELGVDVLYLNPIHLAYTNHGYDALDHAQVAPYLGTRDDLAGLASDLHSRDLKLLLDGVFNHVGRRSARFVQASAAATAPYREWFDFNDAFVSGVRCWWLAENLPELVLENPDVRDYVYRGVDSIVRTYLRSGVDGWRLDVAMDIGIEILAELTAAAHDEKPGSLVVGEIANFPKEWFAAVDGVLNFGLRSVVLGMANRAIGARHGQAMIERWIRECDYEHVLKSWNYLENHDTPRLATSVADPAARRLAQVLQFTLPGCPNLYYGGELGMVGAGDPEMRAPMRWDLVTPQNADLAWHRSLIGLRHTHRALRVGEFRTLVTDRLFGFERFTDRVADAVLVLANPGREPVTETVLVPDSKFMNSFDLLDLLGNLPAPIRMGPALIEVTLPPSGVAVLAANTVAEGGYSSYKRVR